MKWQTDKEPQDCCLTDVYQDQKAALAAAKSADVVDVQPEGVKPRPMINIGKEHFIVLEAYRGNL